MRNSFAQLIDRCLAGEPGAMRQLVERYQDRIFGLCYRMLGRREDAEDAAQETLVRMLRSLHRWDRRRPFEPWVLAIAGNRCRTMLAVRKRTPRFEPLRDEAHPAGAAPPGALEQAAEELARALAQLRPEHRQALLLFHTERFTHAEVAAALGRPPGTIKTWIRQARLRLLKILAARGVLEEARCAMP